MYHLTIAVLASLSTCCTKPVQITFTGSQHNIFTVSQHNCKRVERTRHFVPVYSKTVLCVLGTHYVFFEYTFQRTHQICKHIKYRTQLSNNPLIARKRHACNRSINVKPLKNHIENVACMKKKYIPKDI